MPAAVHHGIPRLLSVILPTLGILVFGGGIAHELGLFERSVGAVDLVSPQVVTIAAGTFTYRADGQFYRNGFAVDPPMVERTISAPLTIMKFQVSEGDYERCVADGRCAPTEPAHRFGADHPVTGVSWDDATAYAEWLSAHTGMVWTLPTQEQMAFAAGSRFPDDALGIDADGTNPAVRWLADYDRETRRQKVRERDPQVAGHFGENEHGLADFAGNVWEWTTSCERRVELADGNGSPLSISTCGIYVTVGQHRAPMSAFIRDPKTGGCSVGTPPANLGFRLVRDQRWFARAIFRLRKSGILS